MDALTPWTLGVKPILGEVHKPAELPGYRVYHGILP